MRNHRLILVIGAAALVSVAGATPAAALDLNPFRAAKKVVNAGKKGVTTVAKTAGDGVKVVGKGIGKVAKAGVNTGLKGAYVAGDVAKRGTERVLVTANKVPGVNVFSQPVSIGYGRVAYKRNYTADGKGFTVSPRRFLPPPSR